MDIYKFIQKTLLPVILITLGTSCKKSDEKIDFRNPALSECLLSEIIVVGKDTTTLIYDEASHLIKLQKSETEYTSIIYDTEGNVSQIEEYLGGEKTNYTTYMRLANEVEAIFYEYQDSKWLGKYKNIIELNENNEIIRETEYTKDAGADVWIEDGDYYTYQWENGNLLKAENWDNYSSPATKKNTGLYLPGLFKSAKKVYLSRNKSKNKTGDYKVFSTTLFEYDNKINSFRFLTIGNYLLAPDVFNISKNNWSKLTYNDINQRNITCIFTFGYNDKNYPTSLEKNYTDISVSGTIIISQTEYYKYNCN